MHALGRVSDCGTRMPESFDVNDTAYSDPGTYHFRLHLELSDDNKSLGGSDSPLPAGSSRTFGMLLTGPHCLAGSPFLVLRG